MKETKQPILTTTETFADMLTWAEATGESYDAICEARKVPARLGLVDDDLGLIPVDLGYFETHIATSAYATVSNARDQKAARQRGNARLRALLTRFHAARTGPQAGSPDVRAAWDDLMIYVRKREGFQAKGAPFTTGKHKSLAMLRARARLAPVELDQAEIDRIGADCSSDKRKSLRKSIGFLNRLIREREAHPEIADQLPGAPVGAPAAKARGRRILWESLPAPFRASADRAFAATVAGPADKVDDARVRINAGEDPVSVFAELNETAAEIRKPPRNRASAIAGYQSAVSWLVRAAEDIGIARASLGTLEDVLRFDVIDAACTAQRSRPKRDPLTGEVVKTQSLNNRLMALKTVCRRGLKRPDLLTLLDGIEALHLPAILKPSQATMPREIEAFCQRLQHHPEIAARLVRAPWRLADVAEEKLKAAGGHPGAELTALRLYAAAVLFAIQMSRPVRAANLIRLRHRSAPEAHGNMTWHKNQQHAELRFYPHEVKTGTPITVHVLKRDATILWRWQHELRARYVLLRGIADSPYLFPGDAVPRLLKNDVTLPRGCLAPASFAEIWNDGCEHLGLDLVLHMCRHAIATLCLAVYPGNFALAGAVLGIAEDTVRRHYGKDSGEAAAQAVRAELLSTYPDIFKQLKRRAQQ